MRDVMRRSAGVLIAAVLGAVPASAQRPALGAQDMRRWAAVLAVADARRQDTVAVDEALRSSVPALRAAAVRTIGQNRIAARYATLRTLLTDPDSTVAGDAAFALGLAADTAACPGLRAQLRRTRTAAAAAWALGELSARCGTFASVFGDATSPSARAAVLQVAGKWSPFPDSVVTLAARRATTPPELAAALYALGRARRNTGAALASTASRHRDAGIREIAARLLAAPLQPDSSRGSALARLRGLLHDRDAHVRIAAARAAGTWRTDALPALRDAWETEADRNVRVTLAGAVATAAPAEDPIWRRWWSADTTHAVRRALLASAWQSGAIDALSPDSLRTDTTDFRIRVAMIEGAASAAIDRHWRAIAARLSDSDRRVRAAAYDALRRAPGAIRDSLDWSAAQAQARADSAAAAAVDSVRAMETGRLAPADYLRIVREFVEPTLRGQPRSLLISTGAGSIRIQLDGVQAPMTADHLTRLARRGYFAGLRFHRVVPAFVAQGGDPDGDGNGGPGLAIRDELNRSWYRRGAVGMALSGPDTGGSQFFLTLAPQPHLNGHYTVFGRVSAGLAAMDALVQGAVITSIVPQPE